MDATFEEVVIASYLHDVGKFAQRAGKNIYFTKSMEGHYCKQHKGGWYSHQHVLYTHGFLEKYRNVFPDGINVMHIIQLASAHHNPSTAEEWIIAEGDRLSSGSDRCNILGITEENDVQNEEKLSFYEKPMLHLMSTLKINQSSNSQTAYCKLKPLDEDVILSVQNKKIGKEDYENLWDEFERDFSKLEGLNFTNFIQSLETLLKRYMWCIPSATNSDADISLYQHSKTTAAFAACLYRFHENNNELNTQNITDSKTQKFMFINGDISGIQKYIFDLKTTEDSAKLLRAKSFQLLGISQILSEYICKYFNVCDANVITFAGGKFIVVVPNSEDVKCRLEKLQEEIESYFMKEFAGNLSVIISEGVIANGQDLQKENARSLFNKIGTVADQSKQKKMQKAIRKNGAILSDFYDELQRNGECPKCGIFAANDQGGECKNCEKLTEIGGKLLKGSVIKLHSDELKHFGQMINVYRNSEKTGKDLYTINEYKPGEPLMFLPYTAPWLDEEEGCLKSFADIANEVEGNNKLAMFKADIDNLGLIFAKALGDRISISRYADLSFMLHYFFSAFYTWFVKNTEDPNAHGSNKYYADTIYTVFSGGDDLCVIGAWDSVMYFARDFQKALIQFTNNNPDVTISGGISLASPNIPVNIIAEMAEENLEKSKNRKENDKTVKNAITVFDTTVSWDEYSECLKDGSWLDSLLENKSISTGVIYKMINFARCAEEVKSGNIKSLLDVKNRTWKSHFYYIVNRNVKDDSIKKKLLGFAVKEEDMINSRIAVSYALYKQRNNS